MTEQKSSSTSANIPPTSANTALNQVKYLKIKSLRLFITFIIAVGYIVAVT